MRAPGLYLRPGIRQLVSLRPRIVGIEHVLMRARDPGASGDEGDDAPPAPDRHLISIRQMNSEAMIERPTKLSPTFNRPRA